MLPHATTPPRFVTLVLLTAISVLSLNMFLPSLSNIAGDFDVDYALVSLSVSGYLAVSAVLQIIMGPLSDRWGRRPVLLLSLAVFAVASFGCWLAANIWVFLFFRLLQSAVIAGAALSRAVIRDIAPPQEAASMMGYVGMVMALAPLVGPVAGGAIDEFWGWRVTFLLFTGMGLCVFLLCWSDLGETNRSKSATLRTQFKTYPLLLRSRLFWVHVGCQALSLGAFYTFITGASLVGEASFGLTPAKLGIGMGATTAGFIVGTFLSGRFSKRFAISTMMVAGRSVALGGVTVGTVVLAVGVFNPYVLFGSVVFIGLGNGLTLPASSAGAMSVRPDLAGSASGLSGAAVVGGGAVLTFITGTVLPADGVFVLMGLLIAVNALSLVCAFAVRTLEQH